MIQLPQLTRRSFLELIVAGAVGAAVPMLGADITNKLAVTNQFAQTQSLLKKQHPKGHTIYFSKDVNGKREFWVMNDDGQNLEQIAMTAPYCRVSPDGKLIAAISSERNVTVESYGINEIRNSVYIEVTNLLTGQKVEYDKEFSLSVPSKAHSLEGHHFSLVWSLDSKSFALSAIGHVSSIRTVDMEHTVFCSEIDLMEFNGKGLNLKREIKEELKPFAPSFSPDGKHVIFESSKGLVIDSNLVTHTKSGDDCNSFVPIWSPKGDKIIFMSDRNGETYWSGINYPVKKQKKYMHLYVMNADGTNPQRLTEEDYSDEYELNIGRWSPDGKKIAYCPSNRARMIHILDINTRKIIKIDTIELYSSGFDKGFTIGEGDDSFEMMSISTYHNRDYVLEWSPDGKSLIFLGVKKVDDNIVRGNKVIYKLEMDGKFKPLLENVEHVSAYR